MPFGLMNRPAAFQQFINNVLGNMLDVCAIGYLDDILIYLDLLDQHRSQVREVLMHLQKVGLFANPKKCKFHTNTIEYLGFIMSPEGLRMDLAKVTMILKWPEPRNIKDIQSFLGFANFYRQFINGYSKMIQPLTQLCRKSMNW